jgi:hypothetical protein
MEVPFVSIILVATDGKIDLENVFRKLQSHLTEMYNNNEDLGSNCSNLFMGVMDNKVL